uniref:Exonuclease domain-containing protein n=1 Tax=Kwoniella dejecticola CBS 10117 TaxID=1296121 RepID=A0A1A6AD31_9TREE|nr:uncharacterized protein I303_02169 [Kwoniella dejecticola CBS 10117]OBR87953.1 hypothetical protein I303_02169 [Kwoniella dejecticola CBS 10117]
MSPDSTLSEGSSTKRKTPIPEVNGNGQAAIDEDGFTKVPTREEKRKKKKLNKHRPSFQYQLGEFRYGKKVGIAHVRDLVLYIVAEANKPSWIQIENKSFISHTVVLFVPGLLPSHLGLEQNSSVASMPFPTIPSDPSSSKQARVPAIPKLFAYACPTRAPGDDRKLHSVLNSLLMSPIPDTLKKQKHEEARQLAEAATSSDIPPFLYLLTPHQMIDNDYPLPSYISPSDNPIIPGLDLNTLPESGNKRDDPWVETPQADTSPGDGKWPVLAIDCEMVLSEDGQELARVSIIDFESGENIFDELVTPPKPIIDYRTQWSGITAEKLKPATHTVQSIQEALVSGPNPIITPHTILLGHSLECDLIALRIKHPLCIDTALMYKHPRGPPFKSALKWLAQRWLKKDIQAGEHGHDSEEDAKTCVELLKMKIKYGPDFGNALENMEPIFERLNRCKPAKTSALIDYGNPRSSHGSKATTAIRCGDDDEIVEKMLEHVEGHDLIFGRLMELANVQGWNDRGIDSTEFDAADLDSALTGFSDRLSKLHESLPSNTALVVLTGHSSPLPMLKLTAKRQNWERLAKTVGMDEMKKEDKWMMEDDRELEGAVSEAREGMAFFCVKG